MTQALAVHVVWGVVVIVVTLLVAVSFDDWTRRRYPLQMQTSDPKQILPLAPACGMVEDKTEANA
jgi:hypothetical protein